MTNWREALIFLWRPYWNCSQNIIPVEKKLGGGAYDMVFNFTIPKFDTCIQFKNTLAIFEGLPAPLMVGDGA